MNHRSIFSRLFSAILIITLALAAIPVTQVYAADTGWNSPTFCISTSANTWTTPGYAIADDGQNATVAADNANLDCAFNLPAIPAGNVITGIEVRFQGSSSGTREADNVEFSSDGGATYNTNTPTTAFTATETVFTLGNTNDTWGRTWSASDFTAGNFRVRFQSNAGTGTISMDYLEVRVTYHTNDMNISGNGVSIADGDTTTSIADHTNLGTLLVGNSITRTYTITNTGFAPLTLGGITIGGAQFSEFTVASNPTSPVPAGGSTTFQITFTPTATGNRNATFSIANDDPDENPYNFNISGVGSSSPDMIVTGNGATIADGDTTPSPTDGTDFGNVGLSTGSVKTYTITNTGVSNLTLGTITIGGAQASEFSVTLNPTTPVPPGGSTTFQITFTPLAVGARAATFSIVNNDPGGGDNPYNFSLSGTGVSAAPETEIQHNGIIIVDGDGTQSLADGTNLGNTPIGTGVTLTYTIRNWGDANLTLGATSFVGGQSAEFSVTTAPVTPIVPGGSTTFQITCTPTTAGNRDSQFSIVTNDSSENPYNFDVRCVGIGPEIVIQGNGSVNIVDGDITPSGADGTAFGNVSVGSSLVRTFTIQNTGNTSLSLGAITMTGSSNFSIATAPVGPVPAGGSTTFQIQYAPIASGPATASFSIANDDFNENPFNFDLSGSGITGVPEIDIRFNNISIPDGDNTRNASNGTNFGSVAIGSYAELTYTIHNLGSTDLTLTTPINFTGAALGNYSVTTSPTFPIPAGGSTSFVLRFTPTATGNRDATFNIVTNDADETTYNFNFRSVGVANSAPIITSNGGDATASISVPENQTAVTTVTAFDSNPLQTLTFSITGGVDQGDFSIVPSTGVLTFSPAPDFEIPSDADTNNTYIVLVTASDGLATDDQTITVTVTNANDAPVLALIEGAALAYNEGQSATAITSTTTAADADNANLTGATIQITGNYQNGQDVLAFTDTANITGTWTPATGTMSLSGTDTVANYQAAIRAVTYQNTSNNPNTSARTISFTVTDGTANSNTATRNINVSAINNAPSITAPLSIGVTEDVASALTGFSFADVDAGSSSVSVTLSVSSGTLTASSGGGVTVIGSGTSVLDLSGSISNINTFIAGSNVNFTTALNNASNDVLVVNISDLGNSGSGGAQTSTTNVTLTVTAVNDPPTQTVAPNQFRIDGTTAIAQGGTTNETSVVFKATATDIEGQQYQLEVEIKDNATPFDGTTGICSSPATASGTQASTGSCGTFAPGSYKWQYRFVDSGGAATIWTAFSGSDPDFIVDTGVPVVTNVTSNTANGTYFTGAVINIEVTFNEIVNVTGTPQITLELGAVDGVANYSGGTGTATLSFTYTVQVGDVTPDLDYAATASLALNGGTIRDTAVNNAVLTLPAPAAAGSLGANKAIVIDATLLQVNLNGINSNPDTGDGFVAENEVIQPTLGVGQLIVRFNKNVYDPPGDSDPDDVTNPANYKLLYSSTNSFATPGCTVSGTVFPDTSPVVVTSVTYTNSGVSGPFTATLNLSGSLVTAGYYRLYVCGTTSVVQANNIAFALAGNGTTPASDFARNFQIATPAVAGGSNSPDADGGGSNANNRASSLFTITGLPATGFTPNKVTVLPEQPEASAYTDLGDLWIEIPRLGVKTSIVGVPQNKNGDWDVTWLANNVGWLNGTAFPSWEGNSVVTAHVTNADGLDGPFANLKQLKYGDQIIIHLFDETYTFEVRNSRLSRPYTTSFAFEDLENASYLTLITCQGYNPLNDSYLFRRVVRAVLVSVDHE